MNRRRWRYDASATTAGGSDNASATGATTVQRKDTADETREREMHGADTTSTSNATVDGNGTASTTNGAMVHGEDAATATNETADRGNGHREALDGTLASAAREWQEPTIDAETKRVVESALRSMGFRSPDVARAFQSATWSAPIEAILRDAIGKLT